MTRFVCTVLLALAALLLLPTPVPRADDAPALAEKVIKDFGKARPHWDPYSTRFKFNREGQHVYYQTRDGRESYVWLDGVVSPAYDRQPGELVFSADGAHVAWGAERDGSQFVVNDGREQLRCREIRLAESATRFNLIFSPDGKRLAYAARKGEPAKWSVVCDGEAGPEFDDISAIQFSPDGARLAYEAARGDKRLVVADGKEGPEFDRVGLWGFSPDGKRLAYTFRRDGKQFLLSDGRESPPYDEVGTVRFSPDGRRLAYGARRGKEHFAVVDGKEGPAYDWWSIDPQFSPDSRHVAYVAARVKERFVVLDGLEQPGKAWCFWFTPQNKVVAVDHEGAESFYSCEGQRWSCGIFPEKFSLPSTPIFSPDGAHMVFYGYDEGKGMYFVRDGKPGAYFRHCWTPAWSPDGEHLVYGAERSAKDGGRSVVVCDERLNSVGRSAGGGWFSPDSRHLAYVAREAHDEQQYIVCDGVKGPVHYEIQGVQPVGDKFRYFALDDHRLSVRLVEVDWPLGLDWTNGFKDRAP